MTTKQVEKSNRLHNKFHQSDHILLDSEFVFH